MVVGIQSGRLRTRGRQGDIGQTVPAFALGIGTANLGIHDTSVDTSFIQALANGVPNNFLRHIVVLLLEI